MNLTDFSLEGAQSSFESVLIGEARATAVDVNSLCTKC